MNTDPHTRAYYARCSAIHKYMTYVDEAIELGDNLIDIDTKGAHAHYMAGFEALDAAQKTARGLNSDPWSGCAY